MTNSKSSLEERVRSLENTRTFVLTLCTFFGISGVLLYTSYKGARKELNQLSQDVKDTKADLAKVADPVKAMNEAKDEALKEFSNSVAQQKNNQLEAFKKEAHTFTIEWEPTHTLKVLTYNDANIVDQPLGKHDICVIAKTDFHIATNAESSCSLSLAKGEWSVSETHDPLKGQAGQPGAYGSSTGCEVMCGNIK